MNKDSELENLRLVRGLRGHYAGFVSRLTAFILDAVLFGVSLTATAWFVNITEPVLRLRELLAEFGVDITSEEFAAMTGLLTVLLLAVYYVFFWTIAGKTPGKAIMGLRIVTARGKRPSLWRALRRLAGYLLTMLTFNIGFLWIMLSKRRQGWHDLLAGTYVVYDWDARSDERFLVEATRRFVPSRQKDSCNTTG